MEKIEPKRPLLERLPNSLAKIHTYFLRLLSYAQKLNWFSSELYPCVNCLFLGLGFWAPLLPKNVLMKDFIKNSYSALMERQSGSWNSYFYIFTTLCIYNYTLENCSWIITIYAALFCENFVSSIIFRHPKKYPALSSGDRS